MKVARAYRQVGRADSVAATRRRILEAAMAALFEGRATLAQVADRAGVSVQTVLRHFGSRAELMAASAAEARRRVVDQRDRAPVGDVEASVKFLFIHYEAYGDRLIQAQVREAEAPELTAGLTRARADHRRWVSRTYRPLLAAMPEAVRERALNALTAVTDVQVWRLLRRDQDLERREAEATMTALVAGVARSGQPAAG